MSRWTSNRLIAVQDLTEKELAALHRHYCHLAEMAKRDLDLLESHSVEEAQHRHAAKIHATSSRHR